MAITLKRVLLGAAAYLSLGAIASPSHAAVVTPQNITFNTSNYKIYTGGSNGTFSVKLDKLKALSRLVKLRR